MAELWYPQKVVTEAFIERMRVRSNNNDPERLISVREGSVLDMYCRQVIAGVFIDDE